MKPSEEELRDLYLNQRFSYSELGVKYSVSVRAIENWMHFYQIPARSRIEAAKLWRSHSRKIGCKVKDCIRPHYSKGYCEIHYSRIRRNGHSDPLLIWGRKQGLACTLNGCTNPYFSKGLCKTHYMKQRKYNRATILQRDLYTCQKCGKQPPNLSELHVHHKIPFNESHDNSPANLILLCSRCHAGYHLNQSWMSEELWSDVEVKFLRDEGEMWCIRRPTL